MIFGAVRCGAVRRRTRPGGGKVETDRQQSGCQYEVMRWICCLGGASELVVGVSLCTLPCAVFEPSKGVVSRSQESRRVDLVNRQRKRRRSWVLEGSDGLVGGGRGERCSVRAQA